MPIDIKNIIAGGANVLSSSSSLGKFVKSTIGLAVILAIVMIIIVMFIYPAKENSSMLSIIQIFVYSLFINCLIIFFHDNMIKSDLKQIHA
jgi:hypothetical protein